MSVITYDSSIIEVETPTMEDELELEELFSREQSGDSDGKTVSSDEDDDTEEYRPLIKKSSLRTQGAPAKKKSVSWNESVMRQTENRLTVERLKPAAEPLPVWPSYDHPYQTEYSYYSNYYYHYGPQYYANHYQPHAQKRNSRSDSNRNRYSKRRNSSKQQNHRNPSAMLSAWIHRDSY